MKRTEFYLAPAVQELDINTEGILCGSSPDITSAGELDDNVWGGLTFGEN
ncbi:MAG: hypothetical protein IKV05_03085 [Bacteroidales bacterium]|nr:hypothetical protein [Bacteroidales bacterium]